MERWTVIKGYEGLYEISNGGKIRNRHGRLLKTELSKHGYERIQLCKNGTKKIFSVHRLVAMHFLLPDNARNEVNHKDGNKLNNCVKNLEYVNRSENMKHAFYELNKDCIGYGHDPIICITLNLSARSFNEMSHMLEKQGLIPNRHSFQVKCSRKKSKGINHFQFYGYEFEMA